MRMPVRPAIPPPAPRRGLLLRDPDHHHAVAILPLGTLEMLASDVLLDIPLDEPDRRNLVGGDVRIDPVDIVTADLPQHRRRRDREPPIQKKPDHLPLGHHDPGGVFVWIGETAPRRASPPVLSMDRRTEQALSAGSVDLPGRAVHAGVWLRVLRTLIDEVTTAGG